MKTAARALVTGLLTAAAWPALDAPAADARPGGGQSYSSSRSGSSSDGSGVAAGESRTSAGG